MFILPQFDLSIWNNHHHTYALDRAYYRRTRLRMLMRGVRLFINCSHHCTRWNRATMAAISLQIWQPSTACNSINSVNISKKYGGYILHDMIDRVLEVKHRVLLYFQHIKPWVNHKILLNLAWLNRAACSTCVCFHRHRSSGPCQSWEVLIPLGV